MFQTARLFYAAGKGRNEDLLAAIDRNLGAWQKNSASVYFDILDRWRSRSILAQVPSYVWWGAGLVLALLAMSVTAAAWLKRQNLRKSGALRETEQRLEAILDSVDSLIYIKDADGRYTYANQALCTFLGCSVDCVIGRRDSELFEATVAEEILRNDIRTIAGRQMDGKLLCSAQKYPCIAQMAPSMACAAFQSTCPSGGQPKRRTASPPRYSSPPKACSLPVLTSACCV